MDENKSSLGFVPTAEDKRYSEAFKRLRVGMPVKLVIPASDGHATVTLDLEVSTISVGNSIDAEYCNVELQRPWAVG
jgi:hypothetical protein